MISLPFDTLPSVQAKPSVYRSLWGKIGETHTHLDIDTCKGYLCSHAVLHSHLSKDTKFPHHETPENVPGHSRNFHTGRKEVSGCLGLAGGGELRIGWLWFRSAEFLWGNENVL